MLFMLLSLGMLSIFCVYAELKFNSTGPAGGLIDQYATACEDIAYGLHVLCICSADTRSRNDATFHASFGSFFHRAVSSCLAHTPCLPCLYTCYLLSYYLL
jgi:hypothetical protein